MDVKSKVSAVLPKCVQGPSAPSAPRSDGKGKPSDTKLLSKPLSAAPPPETYSELLASLTPEQKDAVAAAITADLLSRRGRGGRPNGDIKCQIVGSTGVNYDNTIYTCISLASITQFDGVGVVTPNERITDNVRLLGSVVRWRAYTAGSTQSTSSPDAGAGNLRFIACIDKQPIGSTPLLGQSAAAFPSTTQTTVTCPLTAVGTTNTLAPRNLNTLERFHVLEDRRHRQQIISSTYHNATDGKVYTAISGEQQGEWHHKYPGQGMLVRWADSPATAIVNHCPYFGWMVDNGPGSILTPVVSYSAQTWFIEQDL